MVTVHICCFCACNCGKLDFGGVMTLSQVQLAWFQVPTQHYILNVPVRNVR